MIRKRSQNRPTYTQRENPYKENHTWSVKLADNYEDPRIFALLVGENAYFKQILRCSQIIRALRSWCGVSRKRSRNRPTYTSRRPTNRLDDETINGYVVATISRLLTIIELFCRISSLLQGSFAKETYNFKEPTNCSHPIQRRCLCRESENIWGGYGQ